MLFADFLKHTIRLAGRSRWRSILCLAFFALTLSAKAQNVEERENALKAGFLFNFFSYVQWPQKPNDQPNGPLLVGVVGDESFESVLASLRGKTAKGRPIEVRKIQDLRKLDDFHLIFITASEEKRVREILDQAKNHAVLTVGESSGFTREGGMINLIPARNRFQLEINPDAAEKAGLTISSQLLKLARIVKS